MRITSLRLLVFNINSNRMFAGLILELRNFLSVDGMWHCGRPNLYCFNLNEAFLRCTNAAKTTYPMLFCIQACELSIMGHCRPRTLLWHYTRYTLSKHASLSSMFVIVWVTYFPHCAYQLTIGMLTGFSSCMTSQMNNL